LRQYLLTRQLVPNGESALIKIDKKKPKRRMTLREESLAENKVLGLEQMQEQMDLIFATLHEHGINSKLWMEEYLASCEKNGWSAPNDFEKFLPWNLSSEIKERLSKDSTFSYGKARFLQTNNGPVYHLREDGSRVKIDIGNLTWEEFEQLTGIQ
jgi:hypothetical protein